jgi:flagellar motility protein MotE (MotC chaperone)
VLELAAIGNEWAGARGVLLKLLSTAKASWMTKTTRDNLMLLRLARQRAGQDSAEFDQIIRALEERTAELS